MTSFVNLILTHAVELKEVMNKSCLVFLLAINHQLLFLLEDMLILMPTLVKIELRAEVNAVTKMCH